MKDTQFRAFNRATPGMTDGEALGDFLQNALGNTDGGAAATFLAGKVGDISFDVGDEDTNAIIVAVQLKDLLGAELAAKKHVRWWLSDAAAGAPTGTGPATSTTVSTGTALNVFTAKISGDALTDADGALGLTLTETGAKTWYLNVVCDGVLASSGAITFGA